MTHYELKRILFRKNSFLLTLLELAFAIIHTKVPFSFIKSVFFQGSF